MENKNESNTAIRRLNAKCASDDLKDKLMLFGQFVGDWDIVECRNLKEDGSWENSKGEVHWGWILGGRAIQDVWMSVPDMGTTVRFYDPKIDAWRSTWISPTQGVVREFIGREVGEEIVLETKDSDGKPMNWIFYDIQKDSFRWRAERSSGSGKTWKITEEMLIVRQ